MTLDDIDKVGLIREAYKIEGIGDAECRSIFVDWALRLPVEMDSKAAIPLLLQVYGPGQDAHPMTKVLQEGLTSAQRPKRRGGRSARIS